MMIKPVFKHYIVVLLLGVFSLEANAQGTGELLFQSMPPQSNPSWSGVEPWAKFSLHHRTQWATLDEPFNDSRFSAIIPWGGKSEGVFGGMNGEFYTGSAGDGGYKVTAFRLGGSVAIPLAPERGQILSFGLGAGTTSHVLDASGLSTGAQYNPLLGWDKSMSNELVYAGTPMSYWDIQAGLTYALNPLKDYSAMPMSAYFTLAMEHLFRPGLTQEDGSEVNLARAFNGQAGLEFAMGEKFLLAPGFKFRSYESFHYLGGLELGYRFPQGTMVKRAYVGGWYRDAGSIGTTLRFDAHKFQFGAGYELGTALASDIGGSFNSWEVNLAFILNKTKNEKAKRKAPKMGPGGRYQYSED